MIHKRYIYPLFAIMCMVTTALLHSCNDELDFGIPYDTGEYICIAATLEDEEPNVATRSIGTGLNTIEEEWLYGTSSCDGYVTRATPMDTLKDDIGIIGYIFPKEGIMDSLDRCNEKL